MTDTDFQTQVLSALGGINTRLDGIDGRLDGIDGRLDGIDGRLDGIDGRLDGMDTKIDRLSSDLTDFREHMEGSIDSLGKLSNQSFAHINEIRAEVVSPWKIRQ